MLCRRCVLVEVRLCIPLPRAGCVPLSQALPRTPPPPVPFLLSFLLLPMICVPLITEFVARKRFDRLVCNSLPEANWSQVNFLSSRADKHSPQRHHTSSQVLAVRSHSLKGLPYCMLTSPVLPDSPPDSPPHQRPFPASNPIQIGP